MFGHFSLHFKGTLALADGDDSIAIGRNSTTLEKAVAVGLLVKYPTTKSHFDLLIEKEPLLYIYIYNHSTSLTLCLCPHYSGERVGRRSNQCGCVAVISGEGRTKQLNTKSLYMTLMQVPTRTPMKRAPLLWDMEQQHGMEMQLSPWVAT